VQRNGVLLPDLVQDSEGLASLQHEVFGDDLEEIDRDRPFREVPVVLSPQAEPKAV
jgi:hypothetical protein